MGNGWVDIQENLKPAPRRIEFRRKRIRTAAGSSFHFQGNVFLIELVYKLIWNMVSVKRGQLWRKLYEDT